MKKGQIFVRATDKDGEWGNHDFLCLTLESKFVFLADRMASFGLITSIKPDALEGEHIKYTGTCTKEKPCGGVKLKKIK